MAGRYTPGYRYMGQVQHIGWKDASVHIHRVWLTGRLWVTLDFSEFLIKEIPAQLGQEERRETGVQPTTLDCIAVV